MGEVELKNRILEMKNFLGWKWSDVAKITGLSKETVRLYIHYPEHREKYKEAVETFEMLSKNSTLKPKNHLGFKYGVSKKGVHNIENCLLAMYSQKLQEFQATIKIELKSRNKASALDSARTISDQLAREYSTMSNVIEIEKNEY